MRVLFVNLTNLIAKNDHPRHFLPPLDIGYCASLLDEQGHETELFELFYKSDMGKLVNHLNKEKFDVIVIKPTIDFVEFSLKVAHVCRNYVNIILGVGPVVSASPSIFLFLNGPMDVCAIGEFELTVSELIEKLNKKNEVRNVKGIAYFDDFKNELVKTRERRLIENLDEIPFPKHSLFFDKRYTFYYPVNIREKMKIGFMLASRGCFYNCIFCSSITRVSYGNEVRTRSAKNIVDEMQFLESTDMNVIYFRDDCFGLNQRIVVEMCKEIIRRKIKIKWVVQTRVDVFNEELLRLMKKAGCSTVCLGIESGNERILSLLNKKVNIEKIKKSVNLIKSVGIWVVGFFIIGNPSETKDEIENTINFAKHIFPDMIQVHFFSFYPESLASKKYRVGFDENSKFKLRTSYCELNIKELDELQKKFYRDFYFNLRFLKKHISKRLAFIITNLPLQFNLFKSVFQFLTK
jgi:radical SAM superfamily enzyme YgiQ (UPF0313 family)